MKPVRTLLLALLPGLLAVAVGGCCGWVWWGGCYEDYYDDPYYYKADDWEPEPTGTDLVLLPPYDLEEPPTP